MDASFFTALLSQYFDSPEIGTIKAMSQGKENTSVALDGNFGKVICRIWGKAHAYMGERKEADIYGELAFMDFCRKNAIAVPKIFTSKHGNLCEQTPDGSCFAIMEYVEGESPHSFTPDMVAQVAGTMAKMHNLVADFQFPARRSWPGTLIEMTNARIVTFKAQAWDLGDENHEFIKRTIGDFRAVLARHDLTQLPTGAIHGDIMWENMKFKDGKLAGIFDFDDCRESYFIEDITKTLLFDFELPEHCLFGEDGRNAETFIKSYESVRQLSVLEKELLPLFFTARFLYQATSYQNKLVTARSHEEREMYVSKMTMIIDRLKLNRSFFDI